MKVSIPHAGEVHFSHQIPAELSRFKAAGAVVNAAYGPYGIMLLQGFPARDVRAWHGVFRINKDAAFHVHTRTDGRGTTAKLRILIKTDQLMQIKGIGDLFLQEGEANMLFTPDNEFIHHYKKGKEYISLDIYYPLSMLVKWRALFPDLEQFVSNVEKNQPAVLSKKPLHVTATVFSTIHDLLRCPYDQPYHALYFENKISLLLFLLLVQTIEPLQDPYFKEDNTIINSVLEAKSIITNDERSHFSIPQIAKEVGLNEAKLKKGFKHVFGTGLYGFLMTARMDKSKELLEVTNKPVKEIGLQIGYKSTSSFIKIFKKRFGCSPFAWRKLQRVKGNGKSSHKDQEDYDVKLSWEKKDSHGAPGTPDA